MLDLLTHPAFLYAFLQLGVLGTFVITAVRAWCHSRARFLELLTAFLFGLLLEQGDIFLFGTYRYNANWVLVGDVPVAIALTWAMIIVSAMHISDSLGIVSASVMLARKPQSVVQWLSRVLPAPMADAVWAILLDLALDAVAIRLGLWTWTIRADQGWFGVPWGNFFAWLFVAFWFSFFTRLVRARNVAENRVSRLQWLVPLAAFGALLATLVPYVALENTAALPLVGNPTANGQAYHNEVWVIFALTLALFVGMTVWAWLRGMRVRSEHPDPWLLFMRLVIHLLFLAALIGGGLYWNAPLLLVVAVTLFGVELVLTIMALRPWGATMRQVWRAGHKLSAKRFLNES